MTTSDNEEAKASTDDKQVEIIPVANKQQFKKTGAVLTTKTRFFKIDFFRHTKNE